MLFSDLGFFLLSAKNTSLTQIQLYLNSLSYFLAPLSVRASRIDT